MEVIRKRRASTEVQELMNAVKSDYEFFAKFDNAFQNCASPGKRQRSLSDNVLVQCAVVRPKPRHNTGINLSKHLNDKLFLEESIRLDQYNSLATSERIRIRGENENQHHLLPREQEVLPRELLTKKRAQQLSSSDQQKPSRELAEYSNDQTEESREKEHMFQKSTPDFWASYDSDKPIVGKHQSRSRIRSEPCSSDSWPEMGKAEHFICLSSPTQPDDIVARKARVKHLFNNAKRLQTVIEEIPPLLIPFDTSTAQRPKIIRRISENEPRDARKRSHSERANAAFSGLPTSKVFVYDTVDTPNKLQRMSMENEQDNMAINVEMRGVNSTEKQSQSDSEDELIIVDSPNPISHELSDEQNWNNQTQENDRLTNQKPDSDQVTNQTPKNNHVISSPTNNKPEENKAAPIKRSSPDSTSPTTLSPGGIVWPDYVITRVGSLLWLDKEVVYPITLDEMRRRIQDPENFSFQMLIAYVRHSRAKGRQFLNYWKCQPSGKAARPNVLSKLCEADAKELVRGIQRVNEEYFPRESLARNAATRMLERKANMLTASEDDREKTKELTAQNKVKAIEKSRSVFKALQQTLNKTQDDEVFNTFNVASHNAGLENIRNSLQFLDGIFERIQNHFEGDHKTMPSKSLPVLSA